MVERGMIHGRFQPFHNGHLAYLTCAAARCGTLFVGITNPDRLRVRPEPTTLCATCPRRIRSPSPSAC